MFPAPVQVYLHHLMPIMNLHVRMRHLLGPTIDLVAAQKGRGNLSFVPYFCAVPLSPHFRLAPCSRNSYLLVWGGIPRKTPFKGELEEVLIWTVLRLLNADA